MITNEELIDINETAAQIKKRLQNEYPTLRVGSDEDGYQELNQKDYDLIIKEWTQVHLKKIEIKKAELAKAEAKAAAESKLAALGLDANDLKAIGLG